MLLPHILMFEIPCCGATFALNKLGLESSRSLPESPGTDRCVSNQRLPAGVSQAISMLPLCPQGYESLRAYRDRRLLLLSFCQGIVKRDEIVFRAAKQRGIPILMVTSGGYQKKTARIIADSILNLRQQGLIGAKATEREGLSQLVTHLTQSSGSAGSTHTAV